MANHENAQMGKSGKAAAAANRGLRHEANRPVFSAQNTRNLVRLTRHSRTNGTQLNLLKTNDWAHADSTL
jgi:hypothetical protein